MPTKLLPQKYECPLPNKTDKIEEKVFELKLKPFHSAEELIQVSSQEPSRNKTFLWEHSIFVFRLGMIWLERP